MNYPTLYESLLLAAAAWRTWLLLAHDDLLDRPRSALPPAVRSWLECRYCAGFWVAAAWAGFWYLTDWTIVAAVPFALSSALILLDATVDHLTDSGE